MKNETQGEQFIAELLADPAAFCKRGDDYKLVLECFEGFPVERLQPLLAHNDSAVRRATVWIASELGKQGRPLLDGAIAIINDDDPYVRFYALEVVALCSCGKDVHDFIHVVRSLEDKHNHVRAHMMFLMSNADHAQLEAAFQEFSSGKCYNELHKEGLSQLLTRQDDARAISSMIDSVEPLLRKYGAIATWRSRERFPELITHVVSSTDPDISAFWQHRARTLPQR
jgi:hypothetical protein